MQMQIKSFKTAPKFAKLQNLAIAIQTGGDVEISKALRDLQCDPDFQSIGWQTSFNKLADAIASHSPKFAIFALGGNSKLPFVSFSTLPGVTCPGAGACIDFCYSYRAWRYPAAFARMCQNAYFMRFAPAVISHAFVSIAAKRPDGFDFRLYVDGDFSSGADVAFWMGLLSDTPNARAYGYSKSFAALLGFDAIGQWPTNYQLNISGGHNASPEMVNYVRALPITRGEFIAVSIGKKVKSTDHGTAATNAAIRAAFPGEKVFPCPGACGSCTGKGHACGMPSLKGRIIAIAMH
jgi:hypothetical protein